MSMSNFVLEILKDIKDGMEEGKLGLLNSATTPGETI